MKTNHQHMNMRILALSIASQAGGILLAQNNQVSIGLEVLLPQGDFGKEFTLGVGPSAGFELPIGDHLGITAQAGYSILLLDEDIQEVLEKATLIPLQAGLKYFFGESQHGLYVHGQLGVHMFSEKFKSLPAPFDREEETETSSRFSWGIGAGYQLAKLDLGARFNSISAESEEGDGEADPFNYIGLRIAYLLNL